VPWEDVPVLKHCLDNSHSIADNPNQSDTCLQQKPAGSGNTWPHEQTAGLNTGKLGADLNFLQSAGVSGHFKKTVFRIPAYKEDLPEMELWPWHYCRLPVCVY
jgi:hypothetical protein